MSKKYTFSIYQTTLNKLVVFAVLVSFILLSGLTVFIKPVSAFSGGTGTSLDPYQITTAAELASLSSYLGSGNSNKYFKLMNNIDLNVSPYNSGAGWTPIGTSSNYFYGKFDGNYKIISNLFINSAATNNAGLFGNIGSSGQVSNVQLTNVNVTGNVSVGALAGTNYGTIQRTGVSGGSVSATQRVGGLIGSNQGVLSYSYSNVAVNFNPTSSPTCCAGGLAGEVGWGGSANNSYSRSTVTITYNAYDQGSVGGFLGNDYNSTSKSNLYSTGAVTMVSGSFPSSTGGLSGGQYTTISGSYWDTQTSGWATSQGGAGVVGKTTAQMKTQSTFSGWDFSTIWAIDGSGVINNGYPYLQWETLLAPNQNPNSPTSLGGTSVTDGSADVVTQPSFSFSLSDPNGGDTVKYQIQIDNTSDFSSPEVDYTSGLSAQGAGSFTVGQSAGSGSYAVGSASQTLGEGSYYWRVKAIDNSSASSSYSVANSGGVAFKVDSSAPTVPGTPTISTSANDNTPSLSWAVSTDTVSGVADYVLEWSSSPGFASYTSAATALNSYTLPVSLSDGNWYFRVAARDNLAHISSFSASANITISTASQAVESTTSTGNSSSTVTNIKTVGSVPGLTLKPEGLIFDQQESSKPVVTKQGVIILNNFPEYQLGGKLVGLQSKQKVYFKVHTEQHSATVKEVGHNYAIITLASKPMDVTLKIGDTKSYDVNRDGIDDIQVTLLGLMDGTARISFKQLPLGSVELVRYAQAQAFGIRLDYIGYGLLTAAGLLYIYRRKHAQR